MEDKILDISVNLARVSDWVLSGNPRKQARIKQFLKETEELLSQVPVNAASNRLRPTLINFTREFKELIQEQGKVNREEWAEKALTWANILQHRARLA